MIPPHPTASAARSAVRDVLRTVADRGTSLSEDPTLVERFVTLCRRNPVVVDAVFAAALLWLAISWTLEGKVPSWTQVSALALAVAAAAPILLRRIYPVPAAIVTAVVALVGSFAFVGTLAVFVLPALVMAYSAVAYGPRWAGPLAVVVLLVGVFGPLLRHGLVADATAMWSVVGIGVPVVVCVWLAGSLRRAAYRRTEGLRERARLLTDNRRQEVRIELLAERSRISREVHDVVAHSLSGIIAQADGGQFAARRDPQKAVEVLNRIATTGREALSDTRGLLEMLRDDAPVDAPDRARRPQLGAGDIPTLVEQVRAGGLPVDLAVTGAPRTTGAGLGLTAYRVVQESLTNVIRHAGPATPTHVGLDWTGDELIVRVRDEGGAVPCPPRGGHGLIGMRERAALHGGSVETGPHPDGGWVVRLRLPLAHVPREPVVPRRALPGAGTDTSTR
ncbi:sensor histidine kinase [Pseudonocardia sp. KRD291]|uniref:sensor histidine kinase n=1 Tax=Pseudonocardia sp. KRD291 TaxID=2792007 RepID=UPI001C4A1FCA|nr:sensor histidine kinase [Pseudonocardia sp. KRD291]MBW0102728.1 sensor histidine kinase [Pseudonocardia sp. KRD291]